MTDRDRMPRCTDAALGALAAIGCLLLVAGLLVTVRPASGGPASDLAPVPTEAEMGALPVSTVLSPGTDSGAGEAAAPESFRMSVAGSVDPARPARITGRCVSLEMNAPLAGVPVRHRTYPRADFRAWREQQTITAEDGRFVIEATDGVEALHELLVAGKRYVVRRALLDVLEEDEERDMGTIELHPGCEVRGVVVDEAGRAVEGVVVRVAVQGLELPGSRPQLPLLAAASDAEGRFVLGALPPGRHRLKVWGVPLDVLAGGDLEVHEGWSGPVEAVLTVRRLPVLEVRVRDASGNPVLGAVVRGVWHVAEGERPGPLVRADRHGRATLDPMSWEEVGSLDLWAWAPGFAVTRVRAPGSVPAAMEVVLEEGASRLVFVRDAASKRPVERFTLTHGPLAEVLPARLVETSVEVEGDPAGRCRISGIRGDHRIVVRGEGFVEKEVHLRESGGMLLDVHVELQPAAELEVVVLGPEPEGPGAVLEVVRPSGAGGDPLSPAARVLAAGALAGDRARIRGIPGGECHVRPAGGWCVPFAYGPIMLGPGERKSLSLEVQRGARISGRVVPAGALDLVAGLRLVAADGTLRLPLGSGGQVVPLGREGEFLLGGVPAGTWHVEVHRTVQSWVGQGSYAYLHPRKIWARVATLEVAEAAEDVERLVDVHCLLPGTVRGVLLGASGTATLRPLGRHGTARWVGEPVTVGQDGGFAVELVPAEYHWMLFQGNRESPPQGILLKESVEVRAGTEAFLSLSLPPLEEVEFVFADGLRRPPGGSVWVRYEVAPDLRAVECSTDEEGTARVAVVAGEPFLVEVDGGTMLRPVRIQDAGLASALPRYRVGACWERGTGAWRHVPVFLETETPLRR